MQRRRRRRFERVASCPAHIVSDEEIVDVIIEACRGAPQVGAGGTCVDTASIGEPALTPTSADRGAWGIIRSVLAI